MEQTTEAMPTKSANEETTYMVNGVPVRDPAKQPAETKPDENASTEAVQQTASVDQEPKADTALPNEDATYLPTEKDEQEVYRAAGEALASLDNPSESGAPVERTAPNECLTDEDIRKFDDAARARFEQSLQTYPNAASTHQEIRPGSKEAEAAIRAAIRGE